MEDVGGQDASARKSWRAAVAVSALATAATLALLVGGIAGTAQHASRIWWDKNVTSAYGDPDMYSLPLHTLSMVGVGMIAVAAAVVLVLNGRLILAAATLAGVVAGPMTLVAAPVSESLIRDDSGDTTRWWHVAVGSLLLAVLAAGTWRISHTIRSQRTTPDSPMPDRPRPLMTSTSLFAIVAGACLTAQVPMMSNPERPQLIVATGWSLLIAGGAVAGTSLKGWQTALATAGCGGVLLLMAFAYIRIGGWPGVAGWEFMGMESPVILTFVTASGFAASPFLGFLTTAPGRFRRLAPVPTGT